MRWYVVRTQPRKEKTAYENLLRQGFVSFLPEYERKRRHARRVDLVRTPLFPRYLFVAMDVAATRWRSISSTLGVDRLICHGELPAPVPKGIVEDIQARAHDGVVSVKPAESFRKGDVVQVIAGALAETMGLFDSMSDDDRVTLLLDLLGRKIKVRVPLESIAAVG